MARLQSLHEELRDAVAVKLHEYGLTMAELGFDPAARSLNKTKRLLALTGARYVTPLPVTLIYTLYPNHKLTYHALHIIQYGIQSL